jgi:LuxR family maltose regulon positive regulatory protein
VPRQRLVARLDGALDVPLTLISAPAGFGKTTLVAEWLARSERLAGLASDVGADASPGVYAAWLTLDEHDTNPVRFWSYLAAALGREDIPGVDSEIDALAATFLLAQPPTLDALVERLAATLVHANGQVLVVLDDYHLSSSQQIHDSLYYFVGHLPPQVHLLLLTRADPPLPLNRWRANDQLLEVRAADLCFRAEEAGALLSRRTKVVLPPDAIEQLARHTDGWPVGLQLLAISLQGRSQPELGEFVAHFTGSSRYVLDYLLEEVLAAQAQPVRDFLLRTSLLPRLTADLCDALLDVGEEEDLLPADEIAAPPGQTAPAPLAESPHGSRAILHHLETSNLFLVPLDDDHRWYRYYHLFAQALNEELERRHPALSARLHRSAAQWHAAHGDPRQAVEHALEAGEWELAADQLNLIARDLLVSGEFGLLNRWLDALPLEQISTRPRLGVTRGWMLLFRGPLHEIEPLVEELLEAIERGPAQGNPALVTSLGEVAALRALGAGFHWETERAHRLADQAMRSLPPDDPFSRSTVYQTLGRVHQMSLRYAEAERAYRSAIADSQRLGATSMQLFPHARLASLYLSQGRLGLALQESRQLLQTATSHGMPNWPITADAHIAAAEALLERNDLLAAEHHIRRAVAIAPLRSVEMQALAAAAQAEISHALDRQDESLEQLHRAIRMAWSYDNPHLAHLLESTLARLQLQMGQVEEVRTWAQASEGRHAAPPFVLQHQRLTLAQFYLADRRPRAALAQLADLERDAVQAGSDRPLLHMLVLKVEALEALNERDEAIESLERALLVAEPEGYQWVFVRSGEVLAPLLQTLADTRRKRRAGVSAAAERLLDAIAGGAAGRTGTDLNAPLDKLTPREGEILRAMARGASNQEIADQFVLTVGTVKGHVNHILSKVGARNRTEAVARGRELGLI